MKKTISLLALLLAALMLLASCNINNNPHSTTQEPTSPQTPTETTTPEDVEPETPAPKPKKILAIGNSFSTDAMEHLWEILVAEGYTDFVLGNLYFGGCSLNGHKNRIDKGTTDYIFYTNTGKGWVTTKNASFEQAITYTDWDLVTIQQASGSSGIADTYGDLQYIVDHVKSTVSNPAVKVYWHMTWAYQGNSTHNDFPKYDRNQMEMYRAIVGAVEEKVLTNTSIDGIIPSGTAIQNLRTSYLGDTLTRDGYHLSLDIGRYTAALVWYKTLMGADLTDLTVVPTPFPDVARHLPLIKQAVNNAIKNPLDVTVATIFEPTTTEKINPFAQMTDEDRAYLAGRGLNPDDYTVLDLDLKFWTYYFSTNKPSATLVYNESNNPQFFATKLFTPATLPVGSIVHVLDGYKYRLEGWQSTNQKNNLARLDNSTEDMVIEESLYTKYNYVAFNISFATGSGTVRYDDGWGFRIYVPNAN